jgi:hypothetical protein
LIVLRYLCPKDSDEINFFFNSGPHANRARSKWVGLAIVGTVFVFAAIFSWRKCADVLDDFGIQLYIPWRISTGAVLYRDLFYFAGGPLSQYYNAFLFKFFGVSLLPILASNLIIVAVMLAAIYRRFFKASDALTAATICLGIVAVFAFAQYDSHGNMNYVMPYSHEALHGLCLSIFTIG